MSVSSLQVSLEGVGGRPRIGWWELGEGVPPVTHDLSFQKVQARYGLGSTNQMIVMIVLIIWMLHACETVQENRTHEEW